jgi:hypothetical protein
MILLNNGAGVQKLVNLVETPQRQHRRQDSRRLHTELSTDSVEKRLFRDSAASG